MSTIQEDELRTRIRAMSQEEQAIALEEIPVELQIGNILREMQRRGDIIDRVKLDLQLQ